jgi:hypothetical protein
MPLLGAPVEPANVEKVTPWWRGVDSVKLKPDKDAETTLPKAMPWPID